MVKRSSCDFSANVMIPDVPPLNTADASNRWQRKKRKDLWFMKIRLGLGRNVPPKPLQHARVTVTRCTSMPCDFDNLVSSVKFLLDGLQACNVIADDGRQVIGVPTVRWKQTKRGVRQTLISVEQCRSDELDQSAWQFLEKTKT